MRDVEGGRQEEKEEGREKKANSSDTNSGPQKGEEQEQHCPTGVEKSKLERVRKSIKKTRQRGKEPERLHTDWRREEKTVLTRQTKEESRG